MTSFAESMHANPEIERLPYHALSDQRHRSLVEEHLNRYRFCSAYVTGKAVLDAACGIGYGAQLLAQHGASAVDAIDISEEAIRVAQEKFAHPAVAFRAGDMLALTAAQRYDVVASFETIEHIAETDKYLEVVYNALKEGGLFFVSTPNRRVASPARNRCDHPQNPFHAFEVTLDEFRELLGSRFHIEAVYGQCPHYYRGTRLRAWTSIYMSRRLRQFLHLPEADYARLTRVRRLRAHLEPRFFLAQCRKRTPVHA